LTARLAVPVGRSFFDNSKERGRRNVANTIAARPGLADYSGEQRVRGWSGGGAPADACGGAAARWRRLLRCSGLPGLDLLGLMLWAVFVSTRWPAVVGAGCDQFARVALSTPRT
jgi:hypothetical protein